jgi:hypothetical protein
MGRIVDPESTIVKRTSEDPRFLIDRSPTDRSAHGFDTLSLLLLRELTTNIDARASGGRAIHVMDGQQRERCLTS